MHLDLATLLWVMPLVTTVLGVSVLLSHPRVRGGQGLGTWGLGLLVNAASYPAFAWRFTGDLESSILVTNVLASSTLALHTLAVAQFRAEGGPPPRAGPVLAPALLVGLIALVAMEAHRTRNVLVALALLGQTGWLLHLAWAPSHTLRHERGRLLLALGTGLLALLLALRAGRVILDGQWPDHEAIAAEIQSQTYFVMLAVLLLNTSGYLLMHMARSIEHQRQAATRDALTGALSRGPLLAAFEQGLALAVRERQPYAVLMLDLDRFKRVNDEHGHLAGDEVLRQFVQRVSQRLRRHDLLGRYGGEEFLVLLPGTDLDGARTVAEDIRRTVEHEPFRFGTHRMAVTVSVGVGAQAHTPAPMQGPEQALVGSGSRDAHHRAPGAAWVEGMIAEADRALYAAKRNGRNRVEVAPAGQTLQAG